MSHTVSHRVACNGGHLCVYTFVPTSIAVLAAAGLNNIHILLQLVLSNIHEEGTTLSHPKTEAGSEHVRPCWRVLLQVTPQKGRTSIIKHFSSATLLGFSLCHHSSESLWFMCFDPVFGPLLLNVKQLCY